MDNLERLMAFNSVYQGKKILITGITGFKGAWLARWLQILGSQVRGIGLEPDTEPNLSKLLNITYDLIDIRDYSLLCEYLKEFQPELIFHLAAQSLVRRSYAEPIETYETNIIGSLNLYHSCIELKSLKGIISVTSDKVYENKEHLEPYRESDQLGGYDMYSSSKACVEIMTSSFIRSYSSELSFPIFTVRAGNVIGGGDWAQDRIIPDLYYAIIKNQKIEVRSPNSVRPWQHVLEPLSGYMLLGEQIINQKLNRKTDTWNFGPHSNQALSVKDLLELANQYWDQVEFEIDKGKDTPHEAGLLTVAIDKALRELKWEPTWEASRAIEKTINWYKEFIENNKNRTDQDIRDYMEDATHKGSVWAQN